MSKRLSIVLEENEAFDKEVREMIQAKVRELVRSEHQALIVDTASAEIKRLFNSDTYEYKNKLNDIVKRSLVVDIKRVLTDMNVDTLVQEKITEMLDAKIDWYSNTVSKRVKEVLESTVSQQVTDKLKDILE